MTLNIKVKHYKMKYAIYNMTTPKWLKLFKWTEHTQSRIRLASAYQRPDNKKQNTLNAECKTQEKHGNKFQLPQ